MKPVLMVSVTTYIWFQIYETKLKKLLKELNYERPNKM